MPIKRIYVCALSTIFILCQAALCQDIASSNYEANLTRQQKINRASLFEGANDQIRVDAAIELLLSEDKLARQVLLDGLKQDENIPAQSAICRALAQSRTWQTAVRNKSDFMEPLFEILTGQGDTQAKLAAEACTIFEYKNVGPRLERIASEQTSDPQSRLHAIYALKLRPEKAAIFVLIRLANSNNKQIADAAALALQDSLGIPIGTESKVWEQITKELDRKSPDEFVRDRLVRQEARVHQLEAGIKKWQSYYLSSLDNLYKGVNDDNAKAAFITERLSSDEPDIQLWAIRRVSEWRMGNKSLPPGFGPVLLKLISANDSVVRMETAKLLSLTSNLGPAPELYKQLQVEKDEDVKTQLFIALAEACNYAYAIKSEITVSDEIQKAARELGIKYLMDTNPKKSCVGADVLGKLLNHSIGDSNDAHKYIALMANRYIQVKADANNSLRTPLMEAMAGLCSQGAAYRADASEVFEPVFIEALSDKDNSIREAAVSGIIRIDGPGALNKLAAMDMKNDPSIVIRNSLMDLAGKIGGPNEIKWLSAKVNSADNDMSWRAMMEIFKRGNAAMLSEWISRFEELKIPADRKTALLELAEQKAITENNTAIISAVRKRLADSYSQQDQFQKAAQYYGMLAEASSGAERENLLLLLFDVRLKAKQYDAAGQLIANRLLEKDLDVNDVFITGVNRYLANTSDANSASLCVKALAGISCGQDKTKWQQQLLLWRARYEPNQPPVSVPVAAPVPDANKTAKAEQAQPKN